MVTISKSHKISDASRKILDNLLPLSHFVIRTLNPDYHVDYFVELVENDSPSGIYFGIQLKGVEKLKFKHNSIQFSMKTKHLRYYLDNVKTLPVYLIIVDITNEKAYWLFIQKYLKEEIQNNHWRNQKTVSIYINIESIINNLDEFKKTIIEANNYIKELWPSSIISSAKKETEYFKSLDPRFDIEYRIKGDTIKYQLSPSNPVKIKVSSKQELKFEDLLSRSPNKDKLIFKSDEIDIIEPLILKELYSKADSMEVDLEKSDVDAYLMNDDEKDVIHYNAHLFNFTTYFRINCFLKDSPLNIESVFYRDKSKNPIVNFDFNITPWMNKPLRFLPYFDKLHNFFTKLYNGKNGVLKVEFLGKKLLNVKLRKESNIKYSNDIYNNFTIYKKLIDIDSNYNLNLLFPDFSKLQKEEIYNIMDLYDLITSKEYIEKNKRLTIKAMVKNSPLLYESYLRGAERVEISLISDNYKFNILQKEIDIGKLALDIVNPKLLLNRTEMEKLIKSGDEYIPLKFTTDKDSIVTYRLLME